MEQQFFSKDNFNLIYNILQKKILEKKQTNIDSNPMYRKELINIVKAIYQQRNTFNIASST